MRPETVTDPATTVCRNCGRPTGPRFCGDCGQEVEERRRPLLQLLGEMFSECISLDSRLARTLSALVRPGRLTRAHLEGRRAPYLRPLRLYFLASLVLFSSTLDLRPPRAENVNLVVAGQRVTGERGDGRLNITIFSDHSGVLRWVVDDVEQKLAHLRSMPQQELLDGVFGGLRKVLPAALVLFVPLFAMALKLLFIRTRTLYVDHLVFAIHVQSALFFALALTWVVARLARLTLPFSALAYALVAFATLLIYMPVALRAVYHQSRLVTAVKTVAILLCYGYLLRLSVGFSALLVILRL